MLAPGIPAGDPAFSAELQKALKQHRAGALLAASEAYTGVLKATPGDALALALLGVIYVQQGDLIRAHELIAKSVGIYSRRAGAQFVFAAVLQAQGEYEQAKERYIHALALGHPYAEQRLESLYLLLDESSRLHGQRLLAEDRLSLGRVVEAFQGIRKLPHSNPEHLLGWEVFSRCPISIGSQSRAQSSVIEDLTSALSVAGLNHQFMLGAILSALQYEPAMAPILSNTTEGKTLQSELKRKGIHGELDPVFGNELFGKILKMTVLNDLHLEHLLIALRFWSVS